MGVRKPHGCPVVGIVYRGVGARGGGAPNGSVAVRRRRGAGAAGALRMGRQAMCDHTGDWRDAVSGVVIPSETRNPHRPGRLAGLTREGWHRSSSPRAHRVMSRQLLVLRSQSRRRVMVLPIAIITLLATVTACDRGIDLVRQQFAKGSRVTIDSLSAQNAALQRQMIVVRAHLGREGHVAA